MSMLLLLSFSLVVLRLIDFFEDFLLYLKMERVSTVIILFIH